MCWIGRVNDKRIAKKDKIVYKVFITTQDKNIKSIFRMEPYKRNTLYETKLEIATDFVEDRKVIFIGAGFHSFETFTGACKLISTWSYHKCGIPLVIIKCIIPKGSIYYINSEMVVVSNKIIVTNEDCKW